jgi:hypothetical protein
VNEFDLRFRRQKPSGKRAYIGRIGKSRRLEKGPLARSGPIEPRGRSGAVGEGRKRASPT